MLFSMKLILKSILKSIKKLSSPSLLGVMVTMGLIWSQLTMTPGEPSLMNRLDFLLYDKRFNTMLEPPAPSDHNIVVVDVDERSLQSQGRWPWSRSKLATLVSQLAAQGAIVIAFDVVFSEKERSLLSSIGEKSDTTVLSLPEIEQNLKAWGVDLDPDQTFAESFSETDVVLGLFFQDSESIQVGKMPPFVLELDPKEAERSVIIKKDGFTANLPILQDNALRGGFVTTFTDADGVIRRSPLVMLQENKVYPSLSLAAGMSYLFLDSIELFTERIGEVETVTSVQIGDQRIPTDAKGQVIVSYKGPAKSYPYISAEDVINGKVEPGVLENSIVFVGTSAIGLADLRSTPVGIQYPGVEVHVNILRTLLDGGAYSKPDWELGAVILQLLIIGLVLSFLLPKLKPIPLLITSLSAFSVVVISNFYVWHEFHLDLSLVNVLLLIVVLAVLNFTEGFLRENNQRRMLKGMFDQYVPPAHIEAMIKDPEAYNFEGESREMTVMFSDIRGFTTLSEQLNAADLKKLLNRFFTPITGIIFENKGTIDKYVGDMVMAFWGAPIEDKRHTVHAIRAALEMLDCVEELKVEFKSIGLPEVNIGVGLNTGMMNVGDMGSTFRRAYTVLGDSVNLGSRLESITKFYGAKLLIGPETYLGGKDEFVFRHVDRIQVKGKAEAVDVYEPLGAVGTVDQEILDELGMYHQALACYFEKQWPESKTKFSELKLKNPDLKLYEMYLQRIEDFEQQGVEDDWDGRFVHTSK